MTVKENIFNILFLPLKLIQNSKCLYDNICLEKLLKYPTAFPIDVRIMLLVDDFCFSVVCVYKSGRQRN